MRWKHIYGWSDLVGRVKVGWNRSMRLALDGHSTPRDQLLTVLRKRRGNLEGEAEGQHDAWHRTLGPQGANPSRSSADPPPPAPPIPTRAAVTPELPSQPSPVATNRTQARAHGAFQVSAAQLRARSERLSESAGKAAPVPNQTLANARKARMAAADRARTSAARAASAPPPALDATSGKPDSKP